MGPYARFDKRLFEMTKTHGVKPMGYPQILRDLKNKKPDAIGLPIGLQIPAIMSRGQNSLFSPEYRMTNC